MCRTNSFLFLYIMLVLLFCPLSYSQESELSLQDLCAKSSDIIITKIINKNSFKDKSHNRIYTDVELQVINPIKGNTKAGETIKMLTFGGTYEGITTFAVGFPNFPIEEETLLFLQKREKGYSIVAASEGKYNIYTDKNTGSKKIVREQINIPLLENKLGNRTMITDSNPMNLSEFLQLVSKYSN